MGYNYYIVDLLQSIALLVLCVSCLMTSRRAGRIERDNQYMKAEIQRIKSFLVMPSADHSEGA